MKVVTLFAAILLAITARAAEKVEESSHKKKLRISYLSMFDGPGILRDNQSVTPNALGRPSDDGLKFMNNISSSYMFQDQWGLDFQIRFHYIVNNGNDVKDFKPLRWQSPRIGIRTTFFKTEHSKLAGALNTDLPYSFPEPFGGGYNAERRTTLVNPGLFAKYSYGPPDSRWSLFSLAQPRFYFYKDRHVAEPQLTRAGYGPELKPEFVLNFSPSANYAFSDKFGFRAGTEVVYEKLVISGWNPFNGSNESANPKSKAWRLQPMPLQIGVTHAFSKLFELSIFAQGFPVSSQRKDRKGSTATFEETVSLGAWLSGEI